MDGGKFMLQLFRIAFGFIFAVLACGLFLAWGFFRAGHPEADPVAFATMVGSGLVGASVVGATALAPAAVAIVLAEVAKLRSFLFHVGVAGLIAFAVWTLGTEAADSAFRPGSAVALAAGFIAGAIYWLIAGRASGCWHGVKMPGQATPGHASSGQKREDQGKSDSL